MIGQAVPLFESGNLLTKEMLTSLKDYSFGYSQLLYAGYSNGILKGCKITTTEDTISVGEGIMIYQGRVYLLLKPMTASYYPTDRLAIFKIHFRDETTTTNFIYREVEVSVTNDVNLASSDLEICRFKLQKGSKLRVDYQNFEDRETEYDTANLTHALYAAYGESTLSPEITTDFARRLSTCRNATPVDIAFCLQALNNNDMPINKECLGTYIQHRLELENRPHNNHDIFTHLCTILRAAQSGTHQSKSRMSSKTRILID